MAGPAAEEDARSEESFQSADEEDDDFDLPQDLGLNPELQARSLGGDGALPPGLNDSDGAGNERWNLRKDGNKEQLEPIWMRLVTEREHVKISKMFSYVLRHAAHKLDVNIRKDGFVRLREIMKLRNFKPYVLEELMAVVYFDEKERYTMVREFDGELLIRANQGHTMKVVEDDLLLEPVTDPSEISECVHGTYLVHWPFIKRQGLSKVARNHIHLANGLPEDGKIRGMRSTAELFVYVDVQKAMDDGIVFFKSKNEVVLTQGFDGWLPVKYFQKVVRIDYNTCDIEELEFDAGLPMPTWAAELAPSGPGDQGTYLIKNLEALISNCKKRIVEIGELKAKAEQGEELDEEELFKISQHALVYTELQSLEQRFRQHKGYRKDSKEDREQRARDEAESVTIVQRKDRAVTPPWERERDNNLENKCMKVTDKEKAEWAAIGDRRTHAMNTPAKTEDPWEALRRGRAGASASTPSATLARPAEDDSWRSRTGAPGGIPARQPPPRGRADDDDWRAGGARGAGADGPRPGREDTGQRVGREDSWRFGGRDDGPRAGRPGEDSGRAGGAQGGPPRFFNSKKGADGPSWRDRMTQQPAAAQAQPTSWRDRMTQPQH